MDNKRICLKEEKNAQGIFKTLFLFLSHHKFVKTADMLKEEWGFDQVDLDKFPSTSILLTKCKCSKSQSLQTEAKCTAKSSNSNWLEGTFQGETFQLKKDDTLVFYVCEHSNKKVKGDKKHCDGDNCLSTDDDSPRYEVKELKSKFSQLQDEHHKLIEVTSELTTALQMNIVCQTKNINSVLEQCKTIYPSLFPPERNRSPSTRSHSPRTHSRSGTPSPPRESNNNHNNITNATDNKSKNNLENAIIGDTKKEPRSQRKIEVYQMEVKDSENVARTSEDKESPRAPLGSNECLNLNLGRLCRNSPLSPPLTPETVRFVLESVFDRIFEHEKTKNKRTDSKEQPLNRNEVDRIVGEVLNEATKSPSNCGAGEGEFSRSESITFRNLNNLQCIDYAKLKSDLMHGDNDRKIRILQALRWKVTKNDASTRARMLEAYVTNDILDLLVNISIPERLLLGYGSDHYVQESTCRLINTLASLRQGRDYLTHDERLLKRVLIKKVKDVRTLSGAVIRNMLIASVQKLSIRKQCRIQMVKEGLLEIIVDYMDEFYEKLSKYCLEYCSALLMNLCLVDEAKARASKNAKKVVGLLRKFLDSESEIYLPYINGVMFSIFEKSEIVHEAVRQNLDKIIMKIIQTTNNENIKKQLDFILQSRLYGRSDPNIRDDEDDGKEEVDLLEAELDQDDFITQLPSGDALLMEYLTDEKTQNSLSFCGLRRDPPNSTRSFSEETKQFHHKPTADKGIFETAKPRRFTTCSQSALRTIRTRTYNQSASINSGGRYPATPMCYMENCQKLQNGNNAPCTCSKCVPGQSRYSCGCYDAIRKEVTENGDDLDPANYRATETKTRVSTHRDASHHVSDEKRRSSVTQEGPGKSASLSCLNNNGGRTGSGCKVCGEKRCECAFESRPKLCRTPTL